MNFLIKLISVFMLAIFLFSCSDDYAGGALSPIDGGNVEIKHSSPIDLVESIRSLEAISYDSSGMVIHSVDTVVLKTEIVEIWEYIDFDELWKYDSSYYDSMYYYDSSYYDSMYYYENLFDLDDSVYYFNDSIYYLHESPRILKTSFISYQWEGQNSGLIIDYRSDRPEIKAGVVVLGEFNGEDTVYYDTELLWLPYPAGAGGAGDVFPDLYSGDSLYTVMHNPNDSIPDCFGSPLKTHCYRTGSEGNYTYSYYKIDDGLVAMLVYENGKRVRSLKRI